MSHGAGGKATQTMIEGLLSPRSSRSRWPSSATPEGSRSTASSCDDDRQFVVNPIRFPGGSIGELAVNGTVNDLAAAGANERCERGDGARGGTRCGRAARRGRGDRRGGRGAGVEVITGDTKVVERGHADEMYICTSGLGGGTSARRSRPARWSRGDRVLVSKPVGEHGTAIMLARGELGLDADVVSDTRSLWPVADALLDSAGAELRCMRDATRGGVATVLNGLPARPASE